MQDLINRLRRNVTWVPGRHYATQLEEIMDEAAPAFEKLEAENAALKAELVARDGWKLVPVEPTEEMEIAGALAHEHSTFHDLVGPVTDAYSAMLAAAPGASPQPERTALEQFDLDHSPDYHKGREDGRKYGYEVGKRHTLEHIEAGWIAQPSQARELSDDEIWKFWWSKPEVQEGEDDSMEAQFVAAVRAIIAAINAKGAKP